MKHNIYGVITQKMKGLKMSFSINCADNFVEILAEKFSNRLFDTVDKIYRNIISKEVVQNININITLPLTVFQATNKAKKSKMYKCSST